MFLFLFLFHPAEIGIHAGREGFAVVDTFIGVWAQLGVDRGRVVGHGAVRQRVCTCVGALERRFGDGQVFR